MSESPGSPPPLGRKPGWLKVSIPAGDSCRSMSELLRRRGLHTVCEGARCPNRGECWGASTATFMILGATCTRGCRFCAVSRASSGDPLRPGEAEDLAEAVAELSLAYTVVTSVDRDDLDDRGSAHFAACIRAIRVRNPRTRVEVLIPDFQEGEIEPVLAANPDVLAHNIETVERLQGLRDARASYRKSLTSLRLAAASGKVVVKSSIMLGLGERKDEVLAAMDDLRDAGCTSLVLGQYLRPTLAQVELVEYLSPQAFADYGREARERGFVSVVSAPLARTSYHARSSFEASPAGSAEKGATMATRRLDRKVPGGKLLRVTVETREGLVVKARVEGDFFAHPEEAFEAAEATLAGSPESGLGDAAMKAFSRPDLRIFGASAQEIALTLGLALDTGPRAEDPA